VNVTTNANGDSCDQSYNLMMDPIFVSGVDFHLSENSPCINAGIDSIEINGTWYYCPLNDIDNQPRPYENTLPDIGADETPCLQTNIIENKKISESDYDLQVYPNPVKTNATISFLNYENGFVLISVYDIAGNSTPVTDTIITGNRICEGKFAEFCYTKKSRRLCNEFNQITTTGLTGQYAECDHPDLGDKSFCTGPNQNGLTFCKDESTCSPLTLDSPFGLFTTISQCYGVFDTSLQSFENFCYYDYSYSSFDKCYSCNNLKSCYDYNSEFACERDKEACMVGDCEWIVLNPELGKGICYQKEQNGTFYESVILKI